jgi:diadenosine tetraphosphate (Ap4A) HIT family hydrolase
MEKGCPFCNPKGLTVLEEDDLTLTIEDKHPASPGHLLVITRRHVESFFNISQHERSALFRAVFSAHKNFFGKLQPAGFNIGVNQGAVAGQTVPHVHVHLIPRYPGDSPDPRGGIRHCIPGHGYEG